MKPLHWSILAAVAILVFGLILGTRGLLFVPIIGFVVVIALVVWYIGRRAQGKPPVE